MANTRNNKQLKKLAFFPQGLGLFWKKNIRFITVALIILVALYGATSYWLGKKAEEVFWQQYHLIKHSSFFYVKTYSYQRGLFHSNARMELSIKPHVMVPYNDLIPEHLQKLLGQTICYTQTIQHGPILHESGWRFHFGQALASIRFEMSQHTQDILKRFFNKEDPIAITHHIGFSGDGKLSIRVPSFAYNEILSGINLASQDMHITIVHRKDFLAYHAKVFLPYFSLAVPNTGHINISNLHYVKAQDNTKSHKAIYVSKINIDHITTHWDKNITHHTELSKWMPWLHYAKKAIDFINLPYPSYPSSVTLKKLHYHLVMEEINKFINTRAVLNFEQLMLDRKNFGALTLDVLLTRLYEPALKKIWSKLKETIPLNGKIEKIRQNYLLAIKEYGSELFIHQPKITLKKLEIKKPEGTTKINGYVFLPKFKPDKLGSQQPFKYLDIKINISMPRKTLENLVVAQAKHLFLTHSKKTVASDLIELENLTRSLFDLQIQMLSARGFIDEDEQQLKTCAVWKNGELMLNNEKVPLP